MDTPPSAYTDWEPYIFVVYSHADAAMVYEEIRWLQSQRYNIAYDEGINPGSAWSDAIAVRIQRCEKLLFFLSEHSVRSDHCKRELSFALDENKDIITIHLESTRVPAGLRLSLNNLQAIFRHMLDENTFHRRLTDALRTGVHDRQRVRQPVSSELLHIGIVSGVGPRNTDRALISSLLRYLSWQGGIFRALDFTSLSSSGAPDYQLEISKESVSDEVELDWQLTRPQSGEIVWSNHATYPEAQYPGKRAQIAESIAEGVLQRISAAELARIASLPLEELSFSQLILKADKLNYLVVDELAQRLEAIKLAKIRDPNSGYPYANLANLLSWQLINGVSADLEKDRLLLIDEARTALKLDANDPAVILSVGTTYCRIGHYDSGLGLIRRSLQMAPTISAKDQLARSLCFAGRPEEAIPLFEDIVVSLPAGHTFPLVRLAVAQAQSGRLEDALASVVNSTVNYPKDYYGWYVKANLLAQLGHLEAAQEAVREGQRLAPKFKIETVIKYTGATYGRTEEQRRWLTAGLELLLSARE